MEFSVAKVFGSKMVLQRDKPINVWGNGNPEKKIQVRLGEISTETQVDCNGNWNVTLSGMKASDGEMLEIVCENEKIQYEDVAIGEVWIAGGQSNMEFFMYFDQDYETELLKCGNSKIRFYDVPVLPTEDIAEVKDYSEFGVWRECDEVNLKYYSAVAYYFATNLQNDLQVPVGIIGCNCGGTRACCWMEKDIVEEKGNVWLTDYQAGVDAISDLERMKEEYLNNPMFDKAHPFAYDLTVRLMRGVSKEELIESFIKMASLGSGNVIGPWHEWRPCGLYDTMVKKIMPYTARGVLWYQGESDVDHPDLYADMMEGLIHDWRKGWNDELPFIMTQLAPFDDEEIQGKDYPIIREQQEIVVERVPGVYCASIGDVGHRYDIHPKKKAPVGYRLSLLARGHIYGESVLCEAPVPKKCSFEQNRIVITFDHAEGGLNQDGNTIEALILKDSGNRIIKPTEYHTFIKENQLIIERDSELDLEYVRVEYAKTAYYHINLFNKEQIPVKPFIAQRKRI